MSGTTTAKPTQVRHYNSGRLVASGDGLDLYRQAAGGLSAPTALPFGAALGDFQAVDLDWDGQLDLVTTTNESVLVRYGTAPGEAGLDLIRMDGRRVIVVEQLSARTFGAPAGIAVPQGQEISAHSFAAGDVTGDGRADIVLTVIGNMPDPRVSVLSHDANGTLGTWSVYVAYDMPVGVGLASGDKAGYGEFQVAALRLSGLRR